MHPRDQKQNKKLVIVNSRNFFHVKLRIFRCLSKFLKKEKTCIMKYLRDSMPEFCATGTTSTAPATNTFIKFHFKDHSVNSRDTVLLFVILWFII